MHLDLQAPSVTFDGGPSNPPAGRTGRIPVSPERFHPGENKINRSIINDLPSSLLVAVLAAHNVIKASTTTTQQPFTEHIFECSIFASQKQHQSSWLIIDALSICQKI